MNNCGYIWREETKLSQSQNEEYEEVIPFFSNFFTDDYRSKKWLWRKQGEERAEEEGGKGKRKGKGKEKKEYNIRVSVRFLRQKNAGIDIAEERMIMSSSITDKIDESRMMNMYDYLCTDESEWVDTSSSALLLCKASSLSLSSWSTSPSVPIITI